MLPTKLNPLGVNPYDGVMEFEKAGNLWVSSLPQSFTVDMANGINTSNNAGYFALTNNMYKVHGTYTLSVDITVYEDDITTLPRISFCFYYTDGTSSSKNGYFRDYTYEYGVPFRVTVSNTSDTSKEISWIKVNILDHSIATSKHEKAENIMFSREGQTEYEPYNANLYRCYGESTQYLNDGRNLLNPNYLGGSRTSNGVTFSYIPEEDVFCLNGTAGNASQSTQFLTWYPYTLKLDKTSPYRLSIQIVSGEASFVDDTGARVFYLGNGDEPKTSNNWINIDIRKTGSDTNSVIRVPSYDYLTRIWIYQIKPGDSFDNYKFRVQLEKGSSVKDYMPYTDSPTPTPDNPSPIISNYPKGRYKTNLPGITIKLDDDLRSARKASSEYAKDYIEVDMGTKDKYIIRECNKYIVTGAERLEFYSSGTSNYTAVVVKFLTKGVIYNKESKITNTFGADVRWSNTNYNLLQIKGIVGTETEDAFAQFMQEKYQQGEPLEVIYALAEPITTQL